MSFIESLAVCADKELDKVTTVNAVVNAKCFNKFIKFVLITKIVSLQRKGGPY